MNRKTSKQTAKLSSGVVGIAIPVAIIVGLAVSTYYDAPALTGTRGGPAIHWGGHY